MIQKIKKQIKLASLSLMILALGFGVFAIAGSASAACGTDVASQITAGANSTTTGTSDNCNKQETNASTGGLAKIVKQVVNVLSLLVGALAVVMVIVGGFRYVTSAGDTARVAGAKNTIIYALIGLVVALLSQIIVHFVLNTTQDALKPTTTTYIQRAEHGKI